TPPTRDWHRAPMRRAPRRRPLAKTHHGFRPGHAQAQRAVAAYQSLATPTPNALRAGAAHWLVPTRPGRASPARHRRLSRYLSHHHTVTTVPFGGMAQGKHTDGGRGAPAGRPAPRLWGCYRGVRARASATTLAASVSTLAQYAAQASISMRRFSNRSPRR